MITSAVNYIFKKVIPAIHEKIKKRGQNDVIRMLKRALTTKLKQLQAAEKRKENVKSFLTKCDKCDNSTYFPDNFVRFDYNQSKMNGIHQRICKFCPSPENDPHRHPHEFESIHDESDENEGELFCDDCEDLKDTDDFSKDMCGKRPGPDSDYNFYRQCIECYNKRHQTPKNGIDMRCDNCKVIKKFPKNICQYYGQTIDDHYFSPRYCCDCVKGIKNGYAILK